MLRQFVSKFSDRSRSRDKDYERYEKAINVKKRNTNSIDHLENEAAAAMAKEIKAIADAEVKNYLESDEFKSMVEAMKRREREKILIEVQQELEKEKKSILLLEREKLKFEQQAVHDAQEILLQNKLKIEEQQRKNYELKLKLDAERLEEIKAKQRLEVSFCFISNNMVLLN
jgi:hypothetical protein